MAKVTYRKLDEHSLRFWGLLVLHALVIAAGLGAAWYMEHNGHVVTGMSNGIVWGLPHVFAVFLIVTASGALNVASISSVFNRLAYKPFARLSGVLAIAFLVGGLAVLVLDLGRPDRLIVAMTTYNFRSIFAWNIYLYIGFLVVVVVYLFTMMDRVMQRRHGYIRAAGWLAFVWRLALTTGTGSIFGFLMAREGYDAAIMAPLFIAASFLYGLAFTVLVLATMSSETHRQLLSDEMASNFRGLLIIFALVLGYFTAVMHLANLYMPNRQGIEAFILRDGGIYTALFWFGHVLVGLVLPVLVLLVPATVLSRRLGMTIASVLALGGGVAFIYVTIIGGQAYPLNLFPGMEVSSSFSDGEVLNYFPSLPEFLLAISGISIAMLATGVVLKLLPFLPADGAAK
jgi:molybdopterin-containing oxidoreductase family membrane subunit